jgi:hypothetical protein
MMMRISEIVAIVYPLVTIVIRDDPNTDRQDKSTYLPIPGELCP